jgi:hypothetical protein
MRMHRNGILAASETAVALHQRSVAPAQQQARIERGPLLACLRRLAQALTLLSLALSASYRSWHSRRITVWNVGTATVILGSVSLVFPELPRVFCRAAGAQLAARGAMYVVVAACEVRTSTETTGPELRALSSRSFGQS